MPFFRKSRQRTMDIRVTIDRWNFGGGVTKRDNEPIDVTEAVRSYTFQKSIKTPLGGAQLTLNPQFGGVHFMDFLSVMDVVKIYEFGVLKFVGYIRDINFSGQIHPQSGKPFRHVTLIASHFGGIIAEGRAGLDLHFLRDREGIFHNATDRLANEWNDAFTGVEAVPLNQVIGIFVRVWLSFIDELIGGNDYARYITEYIAFSNSGLSSSVLFGLNRELQLYKGGEDDFSLWQVLERVTELPYNELWFDNGPRTVHIDGTTNLNSEKVYLIARATPFDGAVTPSNAVQNRFQAMNDSVMIPLDHLVKFDLTKSMEEVYSAYIVSPAAMDLNREAVIAVGQSVFNKTALTKYLYRPLFKRLFYISDPVKNELMSDEGYANFAKSAALTLHNWFQNNDRFLSGVITMHVPQETDSNPELKDPRIGQKISIEDIAGDFYCESVTHNWTYKGPLLTSVGVTRGYNGSQEISLVDKIFNPPFQGGDGRRQT